MIYKKLESFKKLVVVAEKKVLLDESKKLLRSKSYYQENPVIRALGISPKNEHAAFVGEALLNELCKHMQPPVYPASVPKFIVNLGNKFHKSIEHLSFKLMQQIIANHPEKEDCQAILRASCYERHLRRGS